MKGIKHYTVLIAMLLVSVQVLAQKLGVKVEASTLNPAKNEQVVLRYKLVQMGNGSIIINGGIQVEREHPKTVKVINEDMGNGGFGGSLFEMDFSLATYKVVLKPLKEGSIVLPPVKFIVGDKTVSSEKVKLNVLKEGEKPKIPKNSNLFLEVQVNKRKVFVGEPVVATYKLYSRYDYFRLLESDFPELNGFWKEEKEISQNPRIETVNGVRYRVYNIKQSILFAQRAGTFQLGPASMKFSVRVRFQNKEVSANSNQLNLTVLPLPKPTPKGFEGAVGDLDLKFELDATQTETNKALNLKLTYSGIGNHKLLGNPDISFPADFEVFEPEVKDQIKTTHGGHKGKRTLHYTIIPRAPGTYAIPEMNFVYFDPKKKAYQTVTLPEVPIEVKKSKDFDEAQVVHSGGNGERSFNTQQRDVTITNNGLNYIKTNSAFEPKGSEGINWLTFLFLILFPPVLFILSLLVKRQHQQTDPQKIKRRRANKTANKKLNLAKEKLDQQNIPGFFEEVHKALLNYLASKLNLAGTELNKANLAQQLKSAGADESLTAQLINILDQCEMARFAPVQSEDAATVYTACNEVFAQLEKVLK